jgi:hypothetical protein
MRILPGPVRSVLDAVTVTADAVAARSAPSFAAASILLGEQDPELLRLLLGHAVRQAVEERHPDGLDAEDARAVLEECVRRSLAWLPDVEVPALVAVLTGALGLQDPAEDPVVPTPVIAAHALLLLDALPVPRPALSRYLDAAVAELARAQTVELP